MGMVIATVQINTDIHVPVFNGQGFPGQGQNQAELVKSAARCPGPVFQTAGRHRACFGHVPRAGQQIGRPPEVSHGIEGGVSSQRERIHRALLGAGGRAVRPDAPVGIPGEHTASLHFVDPIGTYFNALAAGDAVFAAAEAVFPDRISEIAMEFSRHQGLCGYSSSYPSLTSPRVPKTGLSSSSKNMARPTSPLRRRASRMPMAPMTSRS